MQQAKSASIIGSILTHKRLLMDFVEWGRGGGGGGEREVECLKLNCLHKGLILGLCHFCLIYLFC